MKKLFTALSLFAIAYSAQAQTFVPTTPQPKNILLEEFTAWGCNTCANGHKRANKLQKTYDKLFVVNVHHGELTRYRGIAAYTTSFASYLAYKLAPIGGYPCASINRQKNDYNEYLSYVSLWGSLVENANNETTPVNVAARCSIDIDTRAMKIHAEVYYTGNGIGTKDYLNIAVLQNNIVGMQINGIVNPDQYLSETKYVHHHMLRANLTPDEGAIISPITAGSFVEKHLTHIVPSKYGNSAGIYGTIDAELNDLEVLVYVTDSFYNVQQVNKAELHFTSNMPNRVFFTNTTIIDSEVEYCNNATTIATTFKNIGTNEVQTIRGYYTLDNGTPILFTHNFTPALAVGEYREFVLSGIPANGIENIISISVNQVNDMRISPITNNVIVPKAKNVETTVLEAEVSFTYDMVASNINWHLRDLTTNTIVHQVNGNSNLRNTTVLTTVPLIDGHCYEFLMENVDGYGFSGTNVAGASVKIDNQEIIARVDNSDFTGVYTSRFKINGDTLTAIQENTLSTKANVYPNPSQGLVNLQLEMTEAEIINIEVINALGQVLYYQNNQRLNAGENQIQLQLNDLSNGLYFVRIANTKGHNLLPFIINK